MTTASDLSGMYRFHARFLELMSGGLDDADWRHRAGGNSALWMLAHLSATKLGLCRTLGIAGAAPDWASAVGRGGSADATLPDAQVVCACWRTANDALIARLLDLSEEDGNRPAPRAMPDGSTTLIGMARFLQFHEAYHLGQIGLMRRICGKPGVI